MRPLNLRTAARAHYPPEREDVPMPDGTVAVDPRSGVERTVSAVTDPQVEALLDDDTRQQAEDLGIIEPGSAEEIAAQVATRLNRRRLTKAQVQRIRLTQSALSLKVQGYSCGEIAEHLGVSAGTVTGWFSTHKRDVAALDLDRQLDEIAVPLAVENLVHGLLAGDKDYTLETLKGRGKLKKTLDADSDGGPKELPTLKIVVEGGNAQINIGAGRPHHQTQEQIDTGGKVVGTPQMPKLVGAGSTAVVVESPKE